MTVILNAETAIADDVDVVVHPIFSDFSSPSDGAIDEQHLRRQNFTGKLGETLMGTGADGVIELAVGLGEPEHFDVESLRRVGAGIARATKMCRRGAISPVGLDQGGMTLEMVAEAVGVGFLLASYSFDEFRSEPTEKNFEQLDFIVPDQTVLLRSLARASAIGDAVTLARDLINTPAGDLGPSDFASIAQEVAAATGLQITVLEEEEIATEGLGGLLGVAAGSAQPPRFVKVSYEPVDSVATSLVTLALVGKGVTFDSGGLSLKTGTGMMTMKTDMSGAAAVLATLSVCGRLEVGMRVVGYMPLVENMPGGKATRPGDVLEIRNGKTIEVLNTDAEGRLILADALSLAVEDQPDAIIDLATLTGACIVALGSRIAGVLGNDDGLIEQVQAAGRRSGEPLWPLPLPMGYHSHIESEIADMKNIGVNGQAGAISAALLLERFVGDAPWVHLDIAGPARSDEDSGYLCKGGTGFGVRTLIELLSDYVPCGGTKPAQADGITVLR